jgi:hypothetical protein
MSLQQCRHSDFTHVLMIQHCVTMPPHAFSYAVSQRKSLAACMENGQVGDCQVAARHKPRVNPVPLHLLQYISPVPWHGLHFLRLPIRLEAALTSSSGAVRFPEPSQTKHRAPPASWSNHLEEQLFRIWPTRAQGDIQIGRERRMPVPPSQGQF